MKLKIDSNWLLDRIEWNDTCCDFPVKKYKFDVDVYVHRREYDELDSNEKFKQWILENCKFDGDSIFRGPAKIREIGDGSDYYRDHGEIVGWKFLFHSKEDALLFKMVWG